MTLCITWQVIKSALINMAHQFECHTKSDIWCLQLEDCKRMQPKQTAGQEGWSSPSAALLPILYRNLHNRLHIKQSCDKTSLTTQPSTKHIARFWGVHDWWLIHIFSNIFHTTPSMKLARLHWKWAFSTEVHLSTRYSKVAPLSNTPLQ